jgi:hypothetical protein
MKGNGFNNEVPVCGVSNFKPTTDTSGPFEDFRHALYFTGRALTFYMLIIEPRVRRYEGRAIKIIFSFLLLSTQIQNSPPLVPGAGSLRRRQILTTLVQGCSRRRRNCALLARVVRAAILYFVSIEYGVWSIEYSI